MANRKHVKAPAPPRGSGSLLGLIASGISGIALGGALLLAGFFVLIYGEARASLSTMVEHAGPAATSAIGTPVVAEGGLHFGRPAREPLLRGAYGYVERRVQTCAYTPKEGKNRAGETETVYSKGWVDTVPETPSGYRNAPARLKARRAVAGKLRVGELDIPRVTRVVAAETLAPRAEQVAGAHTVQREWAYLAASTACRQDGGASIGDQRVSFRVLRRGALVSVFGLKALGRVEPYRHQTLLANGDRKVLLGALSTADGPSTWTYRGGGALLLWIGFFLILNPVLKLVTWVPILGGLIRGAQLATTLLIALSLTGGIVWLGWGRGLFTNIFGGLAP